MRLLVLAALCACALSDTTLPVWPSEYTLEGSIELQPVGTPHVWFKNVTVMYDATIGSYVNFDDGTEISIQNAAAKKVYTILWAKTQQVCAIFNISGPTHAHAHSLMVAGKPRLHLQGGLPDLTDYKYAGQDMCPGRRHREHKCNHFRKVVNKLGKIGSYEIYTNAETGHPVVWEMLGVNEFETSHYDKYVFTYHKFHPRVKDTKVFDKPVACNNALPTLIANKQSRAHVLSRIMPTPGKLEFRAFADKYSKAYASLDQHDSRFVSYVKNTATIDAHNADKTQTFTMAVNHIADYSEAELVRMKGLLGAGSPTAMGTFSRTGTAPTSWDWRDHGNVVTPVKDQGMCGTCWAFSTTGSLEGMYARKYKDMKILSEQFLADCDWNGMSQGCFGGLQWGAYQYIEKNPIPTTVEYGPYKMINQKCAMNRTFTDTVKISGYMNVTSMDEDALLDAISSQGPIAVSIDATGPLYWYHSGVYFNPKCKNDVDHLDHAVLAVGYGTDKVGGPYWIIKNSWSTFWGNFGYVKMSRKNNNCGVATSPVYPMVA